MDGRKPNQGKSDGISSPSCYSARIMMGWKCDLNFWKKLAMQRRGIIHLARTQANSRFVDTVAVSSMKALITTAQTLFIKINIDPHLHSWDVGKSQNEFNFSTKIHCSQCSLQHCRKIQLITLIIGKRES